MQCNYFEMLAFTRTKRRLHLFGYSFELNLSFSYYAFEKYTKKKMSQNAGANKHCNFAEINNHRDIVIIKIFSHSI